MRPPTHIHSPSPPLYPQTGLGWGRHEKPSPQPHPTENGCLATGLKKNSVNSGLVNSEKQESARGWERRKGINLHNMKLATEEEAGNRGEREAAACVCAEGTQREPLTHRPAVYTGQGGEEVPPERALWAGLK